ncbi:ERCC4 domain-containing protein [Mycena sp. CBHHK59/15]|nr:ERCC4 domain-containing protein [Mycena sp. CBHHK59/15]
MPRATHRLNAQFLGWLQDLRDGEETGTNPYHIYNKAFKGLKEATKEFSTPRELIEVKGIGPGIVKKLEKRLAENGGPSSEHVPPTATAATPKPRGRPQKRSATEIGIEPAPAPKRRTVSAAVLPVSVPAIPGPDNGHDHDVFQFWYADSDGKRVRDQDKAEVIILEDLGLLAFKVVYPVSQADHAVARQLFRRESRGNTFFAVMREDTAVHFPQCPGFPDSKAPVNTQPGLLALLDQDKLSQLRPQNTIDPSRRLPEYLRESTNAAGAASSTSSRSDMRQAAEERSYASLSQASRTSSPPGTQYASSPSTSPVRPVRPLGRAATNVAASSSSSASALHRTTSAPIPPHSRPRLSHAVPALPAVEHPSLYGPPMTFPSFEPDVFRAGHYSVYLVLDRREKMGKRRESFEEALIGKNVPVDVRTLALGDVAWIARHRDGRECVLDVVLERKRLDDLVSSIKEGRFHEQKFRLHQSAISNVLYLVEQYDTRHQKETFGVQIDTALSSTQVVDGFMVKETKNISDTIEYLTGLTEELQRTHEHKDLFVIPTAMIKRHSYLDLQKHLRRTQPGRCFVTSYDDFQTLNSKSGFLTVRDTWARMLLCVKGMSAEKVGAVLVRWDTPRSLWEAFLAAEREEEEGRRREAEEEDALAASSAKGKGKKKKSTVPEARLLLQGVGGGEGGVRAIGQALSCKLYELFMAQQYRD